MRDAAVTHELEPASYAAEDRQASLFPLRFTPFEYYYLLEDKPDYPSAFPVQLESRGPIDRDVLAWAFRLTHARHPFLAAGIEHEHGWPNWIAGTAPAICWSDDSNGAAAVSSATASSNGLQMSVRQEGDKTAWDFLFHHVAVDGMGAFQFIADLFVAYAHGCSGDAGSPPWRRVEPERLRTRDGHKLFQGKFKLRDLVRMAKVTLPLNLRRAAVVSDHGSQPAHTAREVVPNDLVHYLTEDETAELSRVAGALSVMLNDLLVRDYFLTLAEWNRATSESRRPLRILIPTNLRRREDYRMPAANVFSFAFLTRRCHDCDDRDALLASVRDEMALVKSQKRGLYFEAALRLFCVFPWMLRLSLKRKWTFATAIFSNLGTGLDNVPLPQRDGLKLCGDLVFESGAGAAPIRPDTRVSFAVHTYAGRLAICVRCDPRLFDAGQQQAILDDYVDRLRTTIAMAS
jgi:hypothetical protein